MATQLMTTREVFDHHIQALGKGDVDDLLSDYTNDSIVIGPDGVVKGLPPIRATFDAYLSGVLKPDTYEFSLDKLARRGRRRPSHVARQLQGHRHHVRGPTPSSSGTARTRCTRLRRSWNRARDFQPGGPGAASRCVKGGLVYRSGLSAQERTTLYTNAWNRLHGYRRIARSISRLASRSAIAWRLSYCRLPRASPISTFARLRAKYTRSGMSV